MLKIGYQAPRARTSCSTSGGAVDSRNSGPTTSTAGRSASSTTHAGSYRRGASRSAGARRWSQNNLMDCDVPCRGRGLGPAKLADSPFYQIEQVVSLLDAAARTYQAKNKVTYAYLKLKEREVDLRAVREFLDHIERDLASFDRTPLFRGSIAGRHGAGLSEDPGSAPGFLASVQGYVSRQPLPPIDTVVSKNDDAMAQAARAGTFPAAVLSGEPAGR